MINPAERFFIALDYPDSVAALNLVDTLGNQITHYKVGLELFLSSHGKIVEQLKKRNKVIFLDLKFHDIKNTVLQAARFALGEGVFMFNIHTACGLSTMSAVADLASAHSGENKVIGVTILTNLSDADLTQLYGTEMSASQSAFRLARLAKQAGLHGVVCAAPEAKTIKSENGIDFITVCPGIRPAFASVDDQKRIMTPKSAIENGADFLVIGRPITAHENPEKAASLVCDEIASL